MTSEGDDMIPVILRRDYDEHAALPEVRERMARVAQRRQEVAQRRRWTITLRQGVTMGVWRGQEGCGVSNPDQEIEVVPLARAETAEHQLREARTQVEEAMKENERDFRETDAATKHDGPFGRSAAYAHLNERRLARLERVARSLSQQSVSNTPETE